MKLMDFFRGQQEPATTQEPINNNQQTTMEPQNQEQQNQDQNSDMESFKDLWNNEPTEGDTPTEDPGDLSSLFSVDQDKIKESVSKMDFTGTLSPEVLEAISSGGEDAVKAFATSLNSVAQEVFSKAMLANGSLVKQAFSKAQDKIDARTSRNYTRLKVSDELTSVNPLLKDPSVAPMVAAVQEQLQRKYPDASAADIRAQAEKYFTNFANMVKKPEIPETPTKDLSDFSDFV